MEKLVRDKIPEITAKEEKSPPFYRVAAEFERWYFLKAKLLEEVKEFLSADQPMEELVDVIEVVEALKVYLEKATPGLVEQKRLAKAEKKGSFNSWYVMYFPGAAEVEPERVKPVSQRP